MAAGQIPVVIAAPLPQPQPLPGSGKAGHQGQIQAGRLHRRAALRPRLQNSVPAGNQILQVLQKPGLHPARLQAKGHAEIAALFQNPPEQGQGVDLPCLAHKTKDLPCPRKSRGLKQKTGNGRIGTAAIFLRQFPAPLPQFPSQVRFLPGGAGHRPAHWHCRAAARATCCLLYTSLVHNKTSYQRKR